MADIDDQTPAAHVAELMAAADAPTVPAVLAATDPKAKRKSGRRLDALPTAPSSATTAAPAAPAEETIMTETLNQSVDQTVDRAETVAETAVNKGEQMFATLKDRAGDAVAKSQHLVAELNDFNKGNVAAIVESGKIAAKGFEKLGQDAADYTRRSFEQTTTAFKGLAQVKSPTDLLKMHSDYVRTSFDMMVAETSRSTEAVLKLASEVAQPISNRFALAAEKIKLAA